MLVTDFGDKLLFANDVAVTNLDVLVAETHYPSLRVKHQNLNVTKIKILSPLPKIVTNITNSSQISYHSACS